MTKALYTNSKAPDYQAQKDAAMAKYNNLWKAGSDTPAIYNKAVENRKASYGIALQDEALAICGHPDYQITFVRWSAAANVFLNLFRTNQQAFEYYTRLNAPRLMDEAFTCTAVKWNTADAKFPHYLGKVCMDGGGHAWHMGFVLNHDTGMLYLFVAPEDYRSGLYTEEPDHQIKGGSWVYYLTIEEKVARSPYYVI